MTDSLAHLTSEQRTILGVAEAMLRGAGIAPDLVAATLEGRA